MRTLPILLCLGVIAVASGVGWADGRIGRSYGDDAVVYVPRGDGVVVAVRSADSATCQPWDRGYRNDNWAPRGRALGYGRRFDNHRPSWVSPRLQTMSTYCPTTTVGPTWGPYGQRHSIPRVMDNTYGPAYQPAYQPYRDQRTYDQPRGGFYDSGAYSPRSLRRDVEPAIGYRSADRYPRTTGTGPVVRILIDGRWEPYEPAVR